MGVALVASSARWGVLFEGKFFPGALGSAGAARMLLSLLASWDLLASTLVELDETCATVTDTF